MRFLYISAKPLKFFFCLKHENQDFIQIFKQKLIWIIVGASPLIQMFRKYPSSKLPSVKGQLYSKHSLCSCKLLENKSFSKFQNWIMSKNVKGPLHSLWPSLPFFLLRDLSFSSLVGKCTGGVEMVEYISAKSLGGKQKREERGKKVR